MPHVFFISYAREDQSPFLDTFLGDLVESVRIKAATSLEETAFRDQSSIPLGGEWPSELVHALQGCRVFVPILTRGYFKREPCGREWAFFRNRQDAARPTGATRAPLVIPVLWGALRDVQRSAPRDVLDLDLDGGDFGKEYLELGMDEGRAPAGSLDAAVGAMRTLNRDAAEALRPFSPNAVTDVTGFGLLGHAYEMASRSGVRVEIEAAVLPALPGALELAKTGVRTGGDRRNREYAGPHVVSTATDTHEALAFDPQTAGGLLVSLPADKASVLAATFADRGLELHRIGRVLEGSGIALR